MQITLSAREEWQRGWKQLVAAMLASATGMPLYYAAFSLFTLGMIQDFGINRGEFANVQALLIVGALVAPALGRAFDHFGFRRVYGLGTMAVMGAHLLMATQVSSLAGFALVALIYATAGLCSGPLSYTSLIAGWFSAARGTALGLAALGVAFMALVASPLLARLIEAEGWRSGFLALAALGGFIGVPLVLLLARQPHRPAPHPDAPISAKGDTSHFKESDFWFLASAHIAMSIPGAGLLSQLSPLIQAEGIGPTVAALGVSAFVVGQVTGRIVAGWFLDRSDPRKVAIFFTVVPALGLILLSLFDLSPIFAIGAAAMVGVQQGAEIDLFAYFTAKRFGVARYGRVYGWLIAFGWIGNAVGILTFGWLFVAFGSYAVPEAIGAALLLIGAVLIARVTIDPPASAPLSSAL